MRIALLEDDPEYLEIIVKLLSDLGYQDVHCFLSIKEVEDYKDLSKVDLLISDYFFGNGVTVSDLLLTNILAKRTKVIIVTNYFEQAVYEELGKIRKFFFLKKGFHKLELRNAIDTTLYSNPEESSFELFEGRFFVKVGNSLKPVDLNEVTFLEVDGKYVNINLKDQKAYAIRSTLTEIEYKLPHKFIRIHAAYIINENYIDAVSLNEKVVTIGKKQIPYSRTFRSDFFARIAIA